MDTDSTSPREVSFRCPGCNQELIVSSSAAGTTDNCPTCGAEFTYHVAGHPPSWSSPTPKAEVPKPVSVQPAPANESTSLNEGSTDRPLMQPIPTKSPIVSAILAIVFGPFGYFYLGRTYGISSLLYLILWCFHLSIVRWPPEMASPEESRWHGILAWLVLIIGAVGASSQQKMAVSKGDAALYKSFRTEASDVSMEAYTISMAAWCAWGMVQVSYKRFQEEAIWRAALDVVINEWPPFGWRLLIFMLLSHGLKAILDECFKRLGWN